ncbi:MAG: hypothetical protein IKW15_00975 [Bacteroidales bacterium]|nr:hypothetical protein [Bacteroidales bacterium]
MKEEEFGRMEVGTFLLKLFFFKQAQKEERKFYADLIRLQTFKLINIQLTEKSQLKKPEQLWSFEWDNEQQQEPVRKLSEEQQQERLQELREIAKKVFNG